MTRFEDLSIERQKLIEKNIKKALARHRKEIAARLKKKMGATSDHYFQVSL